MKKLLVILALCMVLSVVFVACEDPVTPPEETTPEVTTPEVTTPEATTPEETTPEATTPEATTPEETTPEETTPEETTPEETTEPEPDPADPTWSIDAAGLAAAAAGGNMMTAELNEEEGYVRLTATGGDPFFQFLNGAGAQPQFMAIVYRTNTTKQGQIFIGSGAGPCAQGDNPMLTWNGNEQWNILVLDLANTEGLTAVVDGVVNYARLDFFTDQGNEGDYFDIKAVAFYNTAKYATDAFFSTIATIVPSADMASSIPGSPGVNGCTLSADGTYVTIDTIGQGDPYYQLPMLNGKGTIGQYVAIKYRTSCTSGVKSEMFVGSGAGPSGQGDNIQFDLTCDGKWHLAIVDLSAASAVVDNVINYLRWDPFAGGSDATIDMAYIGVFASEADALAYDATVAGLYVDTLNVPTSAWTVTGHCEGIVGAEGHANSGMVAAGGVAEGALLHQGYIALGDINLAEMSKVVIYFGVDGSQVTIDHYNANPANRIILTSADQAMTMSPTEDVILASATYTELGWAVHAIEIDLTGVDYNGPVFVTYDTLPGTFMLFSSVEFTYDPNYVAPEAPEAPAEDPYYALQMVQAKTGETLYFTGEMAGEYLATSTDPAAAAKVYVEASENGLRQYILVDGVKNYIEIHKNDAGKVRVCLTTEPQFYYVFNEAANTYVINFNETDVYYLGTYNDFTTIGCSLIKYITGDNAANVGVSQYVVEWVDYPTVETPEEPETPELPAAPYVDKATAGMVSESCDTVTLNAGMYFAEDGMAYNKLAAVENKITIKSGDLLGFRGWIGFPQAFDQFGFFINNGDFVGGEYKQATEDIIYTLAGENASRYHVTIDTTGTPAGDYVVTWGAKLADGTLVGFYTVTVTVEAAE